VFGTPGAGEWGLRFEGHHLSVNLTFAGGKAVSGTPLFLGANPETVSGGPDQGLRALAEQVDLAWRLYGTLTEAQLRQARERGGGYDGFLTRAGSLRRPDAPQPGVPWSALDAEQQRLLTDLALSYLEVLADEIAAPYVRRLVEEEVLQATFYWSGGGEPGEAYYYRIAGPRLFIEHDAFNGGRHIHAVWRDGGGDFGQDR